MPAGGPARDDDGPLDAVLAGLGVEPVERALQFIGDLRQVRFRRQRVAAQSRRPTSGYGPSERQAKISLLPRCQ